MKNFIHHSANRNSEYHALQENNLNKCPVCTASLYNLLVSVKGVKIKRMMHISIKWGRSAHKKEWRKFFGGQAHQSITFDGVTQALSFFLRTVWLKYYCVVVTSSLVMRFSCLNVL